MRRGFTAKLVMLLGIGASVTACHSDPNQQVESAQQKDLEHDQQAQAEQAELLRKQAEEQNALAQRQNERAVDHVDEHNTVARDQAEQRADLARDQAEQRADLRADQQQQQQKDGERVNEAVTDATASKREYAQEQRERLAKLEERAAKLDAKKVEAEPGEVAEVKHALSNLPAKCEDAERDIAALEATKTSAEWKRAKNEVESTLASIEKSLDRAEKHL